MEEKKRAGLKLRCSLRTVNRMIRGYKLEGKSFFIHGNRGHKPVHALSEDVRAKVVELYRTVYNGLNFRFFTKLLSGSENINISYSAVREILISAGIYSPDIWKSTRRRLKKEGKAAPDENEATDTTPPNIEVPRCDAHPGRSGSFNFGEMIQMDACKHNWFGTEQSHLHIAIDDATKTLVGAYFDKQETLNGYYNVFHQILTNYGIPSGFFTDRRTVFEYKHKNSNRIEDDSFTQFGYACERLGVEIKTGSIPQAKGLVERVFRTLQGRLPFLLKRAGASDAEQANAFLNSYIKQYNAEFALNKNNIPSVFEKQPNIEQINQILAVLTPRIIDTGHSIRFENKYFKLLNSENEQVCLKKGSEGIVIKSFNKNLYFSVQDTVYALEEIPLHEKNSKNFAPDVKEEKTGKNRYIPPMTHPWRTDTFKRFLKNQAHRTA
jgi:hypothetical protein